MTRKRTGKIYVETYQGNEVMNKLPESTEAWWRTGEEDPEVNTPRKIETRKEKIVRSKPERENPNRKHVRRLIGR